MGWYDSFRGNAAGVNMSGVGSDAGLGAKAFGDAFVSIGKNMDDREKRDATINAQKSQMAADEARLKTEAAKTELYGTQNIAALDTIDETKQTRETKKLDDAFSNSYRSVDGAENLKLFKDNYRTGNGYGNISDDAVKAADTHFQGKFNDEAKNVAVGKEYKDFNTFAKENEQLIKMADGKTIMELDKYFTDKDTTAASLAAKEKDVKHATALYKAESANGGKLNKDLLDLQNSIGKEYGEYDEVTGQFTIDPERKEEAAFALENGTSLLNNGVKDLASIRKQTKDAYAKRKESDAPKTAKSWKDYEK
ncbi:MAG: hypothetical protein RQ763_00070 [Sulfurimonas sp.]|uniref:hypothetical protein n=1 Tax=Sulfurimonas sp. TaxID=2022749 RepID=UPI0028CDC149|nr:hypothetical protein [Sulfurimonas sp.]MDT8337568.1 hypothetical protein [Sulfurimonas sp.]